VNVKDVSRRLLETMGDVVLALAFATMIFADQSVTTGLLFISAAASYGIADRIRTNEHRE